MLRLQQDIDTFIEEYSNAVYSKYQALAYDLRVCGECYDRSNVSDLKLLIEAKNTGFSIDSEVKELAFGVVGDGKRPPIEPRIIINNETIIKETVVEKQIVKEIPPAQDQWERNEW